MAVQKEENFAARQQSVTDYVSFQQLGFQLLQPDTYVGTLAQFFVHLCKFQNDGILRSDHVFLLVLSFSPPSPTQFVPKTPS